MIQISAWIARSDFGHPTFFRLYSGGIVFALWGFTVSIRPGHWKFDWQGRDDKRF